ncbi:MAG: hypothetical protein ACKVPX_02550 [Myxococcaceae bacterium]
MRLREVYVVVCLFCACAQIGEYTTFGVGFGGHPVLDGVQQGITSATASRLGGRCYAMCPTGSVCNRETGLYSTHV